MSLFFTYQTDLPENAGYELFHTEHIIILAICLMIVVSGTVFYRRISTEPERRAFRRGIVFLLTGLIVIRLLYVYMCGARLLYDLPLHFCSIAGFLCFIYEYAGERMPGIIHIMLEQVLFSLCLPGAALALIFSNGTAYPPIHFITIQSSLFHVLIILYVAICLSEESIVPSYKKAYLAILFMIIPVPPILIFDIFTRTNYMFLLYPSAGSPLTEVYLRYGYAVYMLTYGIIAVAEIYLISFIYSFFKGKTMVKLDR